MARVTFVQKQLSLWGAGTGGLLIQLCRPALRGPVVGPGVGRCERSREVLFSELYPAGGKIDLELRGLLGRELDHGGPQRSAGQAERGERGLVVMTPWVRNMPV